MSKITIEAKIRDKKIKAKDLLKKSRLPWVVYWPKNEPILVDFDYQEFKKVFLQVKKWKIFTLKVDWKDIDVLVKDFSLDPLFDTISHVDILQIDEKTPVKAEVDLVAEWESNALRLWWVLSQSISSLKVKCLPKDLPESIKIDLSKLENFSSKIKISDLEVPENIKVLTDWTVIVASVIVPRSVAAAAAANK